MFKEVVPSLPSLDSILRSHAFLYWSQRSPKFVVPNFKRGVFSSSGFAGFWRRVQKSFANFVGSGKIVRVPNFGLFSTLVFNKSLALPTAGIVSTTISSKTGFAQ